ANDSLRYLRFNLTKNSGGIAGHNRVGRNIPGDHGARSDNGVLSDTGIGEDSRARANRRSFFHHRAFHAPVGFGLQSPGGGRRARIQVVDEHHAMSDENVVFDAHAFTDKSVARDFAAFADCRIFLDLDEGPDFRFIANFASIKVDEFGKLDTLAKLHVRCNAYIIVHRELRLNRQSLARVRTSRSPSGWRRPRLQGWPPRNRSTAGCPVPVRDGDW